MAPVQEAAVSIVLAEDDPTFCSVLATLLRAAGYRVEAAGTAEEALERLESADLLITDVGLTGAMDGLMLLQEAKRRHSDLEVIVITGRASMDVAVQCVRAGAFDLLLKPFEQVELLSSVQRAAERQRLHTKATIYESSRQLFLLHEPGEVARALAPWAAKLLGADEAVVLVPGDGAGLETVSSYLREEGAGRTPLMETIAQRLGAECEPLLLGRDAPLPAPLAGLTSLESLGSAMVVPLRSGQRTVAVLAVRRVGSGAAPFRGRDLSLASVLTVQALVALESYQLARRTASVERLAAMGEMAAGVAHEINNPMAFVRSNLKFVEDCLLELLGTIALLNEGRAEEALAAWDAAGGSGLYSEVQYAIEEAITGADRISALVRDMRHVSRREAPVKEVAPLAEVLGSALRLAGGELKSCELSVELAGGAVPVEGDLGRLTQAFVNLLVNAAQSMEGTAEKRLSVRCRADETSVWVDITDSGAGISSEVQPRIYEPFFTTKRPGKGTGLGLPIARQTVTAHGGELTFLSRPGQGTTFTVRLPRVS